MTTCLLCPMVILLTVQCCRSQITFCEESVASATVATSCPKSKEEWDIAARKKDCSKIATQQTCAAAEKFKYHCVINGYRNALLEVCAPERIILGHCTEFNVIGGVIQDHRRAPCKHGSFPKCDRFYYSTEAYKYPDCYNLVKRTRTPRKTPTADNYIWLIIVLAIVAVVTLTLLFVGRFVYLKKKRLDTNVQKRVKYKSNSNQRGSADADKRTSISTKYDELLLKVT